MEKTKANSDERVRERESSRDREREEGSDEQMNNESQWELRICLPNCGMEIKEFADPEKRRRLEP